MRRDVMFSTILMVSLYSRCRAWALILSALTDGVDMPILVKIAMYVRI